jgi:hypothetical protein
MSREIRGHDAGVIEQRRQSAVLGPDVAGARETHNERAIRSGVVVGEEGGSNHA